MSVERDELVTEGSFKNEYPKSRPFDTKNRKRTPRDVKNLSVDETLMWRDYLCS